MMVFVYMLLIIVMIGVPALVGYFVGGSETTAWVTSVTALVVYAVIGLFGRDPK